MNLRNVLVALGALAVISTPALANDKPAKDAKPAVAKEAKKDAAAKPAKDAKPAAKVEKK